MVCFPARCCGLLHLVPWCWEGRDPARKHPGLERGEESDGAFFSRTLMSLRGPITVALMLGRAEPCLPQHPGCSCRCVATLPIVSGLSVAAGLPLLSSYLLSIA